MRILAGLFKNRTLASPKGKKTRPTSSKVRESLFDILQNDIENATFLDLYAGSGAIGCEALSRGAKTVTFVEKDSLAVRCLRKNLSDLSLEEKADIFHGDSLDAIKYFQRKKIFFDLIYMDPPYALNISSLLEKSAKILASGGQLVIEQRKKAELEAKSLKLIDKRTIGDTQLIFWRR